MASERPETGPMAFGRDWPGTFIRGDGAANYRLHLRQLLSSLTPQQRSTHAISVLIVEGLEGALGRSDVREKDPDVQVLRPFAECVPNTHDLTGGALRAQRDDAYAQRDRLLALLCAIGADLGWEAWRGVDRAAEDGFRTVVYLQPPTGQMSWHVPDEHAALFAFLPTREPHGWDGHTSDEKWARVAAAVEQLVGEPR
jgi:hypothetical protein